MNVDLYTSAFCGACTTTRFVLGQAERLVAGMTLVEHDVVREEPLAERLHIRSTPTVIISSDEGIQVFRAEGVPSLNQVLVALAKAS